MCDGGEAFSVFSMWICVLLWQCGGGSRWHVCVFGDNEHFDKRNNPLIILLLRPYYSPRLSFFTLQHGIQTGKLQVVSIVDTFLCNKTYMFYCFSSFNLFFPRCRTARVNRPSSATSSLEGLWRYGHSLANEHPLLCYSSLCSSGVLSNPWMAVALVEVSAFVCSPTFGSLDTALGGGNTACNLCCYQVVGEVNGPSYNI